MDRALVVTDLGREERACVKPRREVEFAEKVANKVIWSAWRTTGPRPSVTRLSFPSGTADQASHLDFGPQAAPSCCVGGSYIEPKYGYLVGSNGVVLDDCGIREPWIGAKPIWRDGTPSVVNFLRARLGSRTVDHRDSVISLRHFWEWNYYHFFLDVLGKIAVFDLLGIDRSTPLVLGRYAIEAPFVAQALSRGDLAKRNWIVQDKQYVTAPEIYFSISPKGYRAKMDHILDLMGVSASPGQEERVFLIRPDGGPRSIINMATVEPLLRDYGFRVVETSQMHLDEQIDLFSRTRYLVGVHGAGMTNIIFRRDAPLSVLEIHPAGFCSPDFKAMCQERGHSYNRVSSRPIGNPELPRARLYVDPALLQAQIEQMLTPAATSRSGGG